MISQLKNIISRISQKNVYVSFATNSVAIMPDVDKLKALWGIWIDPPWRFLNNKKPIMSSIDCPWHGDFESEDEYERSFHDWCKRIGEPTKKIKKTLVKDAPNDLYIEFDDGTEIQVFVSEPAEESWYYWDRTTDQYLMVSGQGIKKEKGDSEQGHSL
jgi:hypothetical protein